MAARCSCKNPEKPPIALWKPPRLKGDLLDSTGLLRRTHVNLGENVTEIVHCAPAARLLPQLLVAVKLGFEVVMLVMPSAAIPGFERVIIFGALGDPAVCWPKSRLFGLRTACCGVRPIPLNMTPRGEFCALSVMVRSALRLPIACGVNTTEIVQLPPADRLVPQSFVCAKSPGFVPVMEIPVMLSVLLPGQSHMKDERDKISLG
jgi:hypothetical protein